MSCASWRVAFHASGSTHAAPIGDVGCAAQVSFVVLPSPAPSLPGSSADGTHLPEVAIHSPLAVSPFIRDRAGCCSGPPIKVPGANLQPEASRLSGGWGVVCESKILLREGMRQPPRQLVGQRPVDIGLDETKNSQLE